MIVLPYGRVPYPLEIGDRDVDLIAAPTPPAPRDLRALLDDALDAPLARPRLETLTSPGLRVTLIVSDVTRNEPRRAFVDAVRRRLPGARWTLAVATGTHGPCGLDRLDIPEDFLREATVVDHDGHSERDLVTVGVTRRGTSVRVHRCVVETDLVIATGCIRPHYFAGFGAGVKAIFPGLAGAREARVNHLLKREPGARAGIVDGNPCREDLEEAVGLLSTPTFLLDGVCASDASIQAVVCGDLGAAFRRGVELARPYFTVRARPAPIVIASDALPVTASLYQSAKIAAAMAPLVEEGGALVVVAECIDGVEPLATVNEAIFRIGVLPRLAPGVDVYLVSSLDEATVGRTLVRHAPAVSTILEHRRGRAIVAPRASQLLVELA